MITIITQYQYNINIISRYYLTNDTRRFNKTKIEKRFIR